MKRYFWLVLLASVVLSGCGVEWFPEDSPGQVTTAPTVTMGFSPASVTAGTNSTLTFTISNATGNPAQSGLGFSAQLDPELSVATTFSQCGGSVVATTGSNLIFNGGALAAGTASCTVTATVKGTTPGNYPLKAADIIGLLGGLVNGATDQTLKVTPAASVSDPTGVVTISIVSVTNDPFDPATPPTQTVTFNATLGSVSTSTGTLTITIGFVALDANGNSLPATTNFVDAIAAPGTTQFTVPLDAFFSDTGSIASWAVTSVDIIP